VTQTASDNFLNRTFPDNFMNSVHKLREIQAYFKDRDKYVKNGMEPKVIISKQA
jgi:hypothetical protein